MSSENQKQIKKWLKQAKAQNFIVTGGGDRHWLVINPKTKKRCPVSCTPSRGPRTLANTRMDLRRIGVRIP